MGSAEDLNALAQLAQGIPPGDVLRDILDEVLALRPKITSYVETNAAAHAKAAYTPATHAVLSYTVVYLPGNLGNLVHEMTHVAVNEAYGRDFVNYGNVAANPVAPVYVTGGLRQNEGARQAKWMDAGANSQMIEELQQLQSLTSLLMSAASVTQAAAPVITTMRVQEVGSKLSYGVFNPHIEHDTVINQTLVWLEEWGVRGRAKAVGPGKPTAVKGFVDALERAAKRAYDRRKAGIRPIAI